MAKLRALKKVTLSIIIPTLNEVHQLGETLDSIQQVPESEVLVADGGSRDGTLELARKRSVRVISSPPGRARQLNRAVGFSRGGILLFLHADTQLPADCLPHVEAILAAPRVVLGAFQLKIAAPGWKLRVVERVANLRSRLFSTPYGDQAFFLKREDFTRLGGFREIPLMEDYDLVKRARHLGRIGLSPAAVRTSARRWTRLGVVRTTLLNWWVVLAYRAGIAPERLEKWYRQ